MSDEKQLDKTFVSRPTIPIVEKTLDKMDKPLPEIIRPYLEKHTKPITHADLVVQARMFLLHTEGCNPVFIEQGSGYEKPDVIGWRDNLSFVIECKISKTDLKADSSKVFRQEENLGMGEQRYYLITTALFSEIRGCIEKYIPEKFGLIIYGDRLGNGCRNRIRIGKSGDFTANLREERKFLRARILEVQRYGK